MSDVQPRESGRFAPKPKPEPARIPTPIMDMFADMRERRRASPGGFLIEPPVPIERLNTIGTIRHGVAITPEGRELASSVLINHLYAWLRQIAKEGLVHDLELAWRAFNPPVSCVKMHHRSIFDELRPQCLQREGELGRLREKEQQALQAAAHHRGAIEAQRAAIAETEQQLEVEVPAKLEAQRSRLAELEAMA